jgi:hypothetical protein
VKFKGAGLEFNATVAEASEWPSPQTGNPLRALTIQFRAQKIEMHEQALEEAQQRRSGGLFSVGDADQPDLEWRVRDSSSSYVGSEPWGVNHHVWRIEQVERLVCERLLVGALDLAPYEYEEAADDAGVVRLVARAIVTEADLATLSMLSDVAPVIRVGLSETPRPMTLTYLWAERVDGLAVAVRCEDAGQPRITLDRATLVHDVYGDLVGLLAAKGVLDGTDLEQLRRLRHTARHVSNIDGWRL